MSLRNWSSLEEDCMKKKRNIPKDSFPPAKEFVCDMNWKIGLCTANFVGIYSSLLKKE